MVKATAVEKIPLSLCSQGGGTVLPGNTYTVPNKPSYKQGNPNNTKIVGWWAPPQLTMIPSQLLTSWRLFVGKLTALEISYSNKRAIKSNHHSASLLHDKKNVLLINNKPTHLQISCIAWFW